MKVGHQVLKNSSLLYRFILLITLGSLSSALFLSSSTLGQEHSMRRCLLLPVTDQLDGALAYSVFEKVEKHIKDGTWCYYRSSSDIINVLRNYKTNLHEHLNNPEVLKVVANKMGVGSLIKIDVKKVLKGSEVSLKVIGANGSDLYFQEKAALDTDSPDLIARTAQNWLSLYERKIPYDGRVVGVLGDQFTVDIGKASLVRMGDRVTVLRPRGRKQHPLLKEIVEWDYDELARAQIFNLSEFQAQAKVTLYEGRKKIQKGDWVRVTPQEGAATVTEEIFPQIGSQDFGRLGTIGVWGGIGIGSSKGLLSGTTREIDGNPFSIGVMGELWVTRNYFAKVEFSRTFATYSAKSGTLSQSDYDAGQSSFDLLAGYKYLPLGFFYGPQVDFYFGRTQTSYDVDTSTADGFTAATWSGFLLGVRGDLPIVKKIRLFLQFDYTLSADYEEDLALYGDADSVSNFTVKPGMTYRYSPHIDFVGELKVQNSKAKFESSGSEFRFKTTLIQFGANFAY